MKKIIIIIFIILIIYCSGGNLKNPVYDAGVVNSEKYVKEKNIAGYYSLMPFVLSKTLPVVKSMIKENTEDFRHVSRVTVDNKNAWLEIQYCLDKSADYTACEKGKYIKKITETLVYFITKDQKKIFGHSVLETEGGVGNCQGQQKAATGFYEIDSANGKVINVTGRLVPKFYQDSGLGFNFYYYLQLPRKGTTIPVTILNTNSDLICWKNRSSAENGKYFQLRKRIRLLKDYLYWDKNLAVFTLKGERPLGPASEYNDKGLVAYNQNKIQEAIRLFQEAIRYDSNHVQANYNLALSLSSMFYHESNESRQKKILEEIISYLEKARELQPDLLSDMSDDKRLYSISCTSEFTSFVEKYTGEIDKGGREFTVEVRPLKFRGGYYSEEAGHIPLELEFIDKNGRIYPLLAEQEKYSSENYHIYEMTNKLNDFGLVIAGRKSDNPFSSQDVYKLTVRYLKGTLAGTVRSNYQVYCTHSVILEVMDINKK